MKKFRIFPLILIFCLILSVSAPLAYAIEDPELGANAVILADADSGRILYSKNMNDRVSPASLTKIMTVLLAVEAVENGQFSMDDIVTAQADCRRGLDTDSSNADIMEGEQMSLKNLLYCAMIHSANEACNVIGTYISGSIDAFVDLMNVRAAELGCTDTHFSDPNGLSNENHYTTAYDFFLITRAAVDHPVFMDLCNTTYVEIPATNLNAARVYYNSNALITTGSMYGSGYFYEGAAGVKTGYTRAAGYCLISTAERSGIRFIAIVMGCDGVLNSNSEEYGNFVDSIALYDWGFDNFEYFDVLTTSYQITTAEVELASGDGIAYLRSQSDIRMLLPKDVDLNTLDFRINLDEDKLVAPISAGTVLGTAEVLIEGQSCGTVKLVNSSDVELSRREYFRAKIAETFGKTWVKVVIIVLVVLAIAYIALVVRYRRLRRRHLREKKKEEARRRAERERLIEEYNKAFYYDENEPKQ